MEFKEIRRKYQGKYFTSGYINKIYYIRKIDDYGNGLLRSWYVCIDLDKKKIVSEQRFMRSDWFSILEHTTKNIFYSHKNKIDGLHGT